MSLGNEKTIMKCFYLVCNIEQNVFFTNCSLQARGRGKHFMLGLSVHPSFTTPYRLWRIRPFSYP